MLKIDRHNIIEKELHKKRSVLISDLSKLLECSEETIRRDLREMEKANKLCRIHGGAYLPEKYDKGVPIQLRETFYIEEKEQMAQRALNCIKDNDVIMLDSSTTCLKLAEALIASQLNITLITNSLRICNLCESYQSNINLICLGGKFHSSTSSFIGYHTLDNLSVYYADKCFISCPFVDTKYGLSDNNFDSAKIRELMIKNSKEHFLLMDHTKVGNKSDILFANLKDIDVLITDYKLSREWAETCKKLNCKIDYALINKEVLNND